MADGYNGWPTRASLMAPFGFDDVVEGKLSAARLGDSLDGDEAAETRAWAEDHIERNSGRHVATTRRVH